MKKIHQQYIDPDDFNWEDENFILAWVWFNGSSYTIKLLQKLEKILNSSNSKYIKQIKQSPIKTTSQKKNLLKHENKTTVPNKTDQLLLKNSSSHKKNNAKVTNEKKKLPRKKTVSQQEYHPNYKTQTIMNTPMNKNNDPSSTPEKNKTKFYAYSSFQLSPNPNQLPIPFQKKTSIITTSISPS